MKASEFFKPGRKYIYIGPVSDYFTKGKTYKYYCQNKDEEGEYNWAVIETNGYINLYTNFPQVFDPKANGFGDGFFSGDIRDYFKLAFEKKNHLPKWW